MKVLWLVNGMLPELAKVMGKTSRFVNEGWISGLLNMIKLDDSIKLTLLAKGNRIDKGQGGGFYMTHRMAKIWWDNFLIFCPVCLLILFMYGAQNIFILWRWLKPLSGLT